MPQADSLTNVLVMVYAVPSFMLTSFLNDETAEEEELDICIELFMNHTFQTDSLCCSLDKGNQSLFSAVLSCIYAFTSNSFNVLFLYDNRLWAVANPGYHLDFFTNANVSLIDGLEIIVAELIKLNKYEIS